MGNAERFVQIEMTDVGSDISGPRQPDKCVEIGAVEIDLAAMGMCNVADLHHRFFEHAMGRGVGDHARCKPARVFFGLSAEISDVDVAMIVGTDHDDGHAAHLCRCRIGAMGGRWDQADVAGQIAAAAMIGANGEQPGVFALRARVRLHRDGVVSGDLAQLRRQIVDQFLVPERLIGRCERMHLGKFRPRDGQHLGGRVQFHGARPQRNHRAVEGQIAVSEAAHIARHLAFGPIHMEDRVGQIVRRAEEVLRQSRLRVGLLIGEIEAAEGAPHGLNRIGPGAFVDRDANPATPGFS